MLHALSFYSLATTCWQMSASASLPEVQPERRKKNKSFKLPALRLAHKNTCFSFNSINCTWRPFRTTAVRVPHRCCVVFVHAISRKACVECLMFMIEYVGVLCHYLLYILAHGSHLNASRASCNMHLQVEILSFPTCLRVPPQRRRSVCSHVTVS